MFDCQETDHREPFEHGVNLEWICKKEHRAHLAVRQDEMDYLSFQQYLGQSKQACLSCDFGNLYLCSWLNLRQGMYEVDTLRGGNVLEQLESSQAPCVRHGIFDVRGYTRG